MIATKPWYQSKTILVSIFGAIFGLLAAFGKLPEGMNSDEIIGSVMVVVGALAAIFRGGAVAEVTK